MRHPVSPWGFRRASSSIPAVNDGVAETPQVAGKPICPTGMDTPRLESRVLPPGPRRQRHDRRERGLVAFGAEQDVVVVLAETLKENIEVPIAPACSPGPVAPESVFGCSCWSEISGPAPSPGRGLFVLCHAPPPLPICGGGAVLPISGAVVVRAASIPPESALSRSI